MIKIRNCLSEPTQANDLAGNQAGPKNDPNIITPITPASKNAVKKNCSWWLCRCFVIALGPSNLVGPPIDMMIPSHRRTGSTSTSRQASHGLRTQAIIGSKCAYQGSLYQLVSLSQIYRDVRCVTINIQS